MSLNTGSSLRRLHRGVRVAVGVCAGVFTLAPLARAQTPAGTIILNIAQASFVDSAGRPVTTFSPAVPVTVGQFARLDLEPSRSVTTDPGTRVVLAHTLTNLGNGTDPIGVTATHTRGWPLRVLHDVNGDGALDAGDTALTAPLALPMQQTAALLIVVDVPADRSARGAVDSITVVARSGVDPAQSDSVFDRITVRDAGVALTVRKDVDRATATTGDTLAYTLTWTATGTNPATALVLTDVLPADLVFLAGSVAIGGSPAGDSASYDGPSRTLRVALGTVAGGTTGTVTFRATMGAAPTVQNVATAVYGTQVGPDTVLSTTAVTTLVLPDLALAKTLAGSTTVRVGDTLTYRLRVDNRSAAAVARSLTIEDTLPPGLTFVAARPAAAAVEGPVVRWTVAQLAPSTGLDLELDARVVHSGADTVQLVNVAGVTAANATAAAAASATVTVANDAAEIALEKAAGVLEAGLGDAAPFTLTVRNPGLVTLADVRIYDRLPPELRYVPGSAVGADSVAVRDSALAFFIAGPIAPGASVGVRFVTTVVAGNRDALVNTAFATALGDAARSPDAAAFLRIRQVSPMATRAAIGKVWVDEDGDGQQGPRERGVPGVDVWNQEGDVATTDQDGRFSFRNLRTGRHAFRLDLATIPADLRPAADLQSDLELRDGDGWTTPRVIFRLVPRGGTVRAVRASVPWQVTVAAAPRTEARVVLDTVPCPPDAAGAADAERLIAAAPRPHAARFAVDRAQPSERSRTLLDSAAAVLRQYPGTRFAIAGHADSTGPRAYNDRLSAERAAAVVRALVARGIPGDLLSPIGYGFDQPAAPNARADGRAQNRRVELRAVDVRGAEALRAAYGGGAAPAPAAVCTTSRVVAEPAGVRIAQQVRIANPYDQPIDGLAVAFDGPVDSTRVVLADSTRLAGREAVVALATIAPRSAVTVTAWASRPAAPVGVELRTADGTSERLTAIVADSAATVTGRTLRAALDSLPNPQVLGESGTVEVLVATRTAAATDVTLPIPAGWQPVGTDLVAAPAVVRDRSGEQLLLWSAADRGTPVAAVLAPARRAVAAAPDSLRLAPLRTQAERDADRRRAFVAGPAVAIFAPSDGIVLASDRLFIGVRGEAGRAVTLFDGDSVLAESTFRGDGVQDFVNVQLTEGPHRLRVRMRNSWNQDRWDSAAVHISGRPAAIRVADSALTVVADGHGMLPVQALVVDRWGVPVAARPLVTVAVDGATVESPDADASSAGVQVRADAHGRLAFALRAGRTVGTGALQLDADTASATHAFDLLPPVRPLMVTGVGRIGAGASPEDFGTITARGRLDARTGIVLRYDSRDLDAGRAAFGREADPLEEAQYPILGDGGQLRTLGASRTQFSARVERGFDWLAAGDILNEGFDRGLQLSDYRRALTGVAGRVTTGRVTWHGFGSSTSQALRQVQLRGAGTSGPYELGGEIYPGTERIVLETRAVENPTRVVSREALVRWADYQLDYRSGLLLLKRPVPATDVYGNPVFLVAIFEAQGGGERSAVWGLRATTDLIRGGADSIRLGATVVHDGVQTTGYTLSGLDARLLRSGLDLRAEVAAARSSDSSGVATSLRGTYRATRWLDLGLRWSSISGEFRNPSDPALRAGTRELGLSARAHTTLADLRLEHERQWFDTEGVGRERTRVAASRTVAANVTVEASAVADRAVTAVDTNSAQAGELKLTWRPRPALELWTEGRHQFSEPLAARPDFVGVGGRVRLLPQVSLEAQHRQVFLPGTDGYRVTDVGLRSQVSPGTEAWGTYQLAGIDGRQSAALVGLSSRQRIGASWMVSGMFERRSGVGAADPLDPVRALPFLQQEEDYWTVGGGLEFLRPNAPYRVGARGEYRDGATRSSRLLTVAGDLSANRSLALLSRQEYLQTTQVLAAGPQDSRRFWSLWGLAFRPVASDRLNALLKLEWLDAENPAGTGVLTNQGHEDRLITALEAIYAPARRTEFAGRIALRRTSSTVMLEDTIPQRLTADAGFLGARGQTPVAGPLWARAEARLLLERQTGTHRYDVAPQAVLVPVTGLEVAAGYRWGDLHDADFAVSGGNGFFVTLGVALTERSAASAAAYWRERLGRR